MGHAISQSIIERNNRAERPVGNGVQGSNLPMLLCEQGEVELDPIITTQPLAGLRGGVGKVTDDGQGELLERALFNDAPL